MKYSYRTRILFVDDGEFWRERVSSKLASLGYMVKAPPGTGQKLIDDSITLARKFRPHIVILDLDLRDAGGSDTSGFNVLNEMDHAKCIIYSAYLRWEFASDSKLKERVSFISKSSGPELLISEVQELASQICASRKNMKLTLPDKYPLRMIARHLSEADNVISTRVIPEVIIGCFPGAETINLETISGAAESPNQASRGRSLVLKAHVGLINKFIIKFSQASKIQIEFDKFNTYIKNNLGGFFYADIRSDPSFFWELGGLVYTFLGDLGRMPLMTFSNHFLHADNIQSAMLPIEYFIKDIWIGHYKKKIIDDTETSLFDAYNTFFKFKEKEKYIKPPVDVFSLSEGGITLKDPIAWIKKHAEASHIPDTWLAVTHGDLHGDNLFTDGEHAWAIDFERCGPGPILRDFVEMEVDILTRLIHPEGMDDFKYFKFVIGLFTKEFLEMKKEPVRDMYTDDVTYKMAGFIYQLRKLAKEVTQYSDPRELLWGLLLDAVFIYCWKPTSDEQAKQIIRAQVLGSVICERLQNWAKPWPLTMWK